MKEGDAPLLISSRWQLGEFIFLEFRQGGAVLLDIGPFPEDPDDEQIEKALSYLTDAHLDFLTLGDQEWVLNRDLLLTRFPELKLQNLTGSISHAAAFETTSIYLPKPDRYFNRALVPETNDGVYLLRLSYPMPGAIHEESKDLASIKDSNVAPGSTPISASRNDPEPGETCYLFTRLTLDVCAEKLLPYVVAPMSSSIVEVPVQSREYIAEIKGRSFTIRAGNSPEASTRYRIFFTGAWSAQDDGGTLIGGHYGMETLSPFRMRMFTAGIVLSIGLALLGWRELLNVNATLAMMVIGGVLFFVALILSIICFDRIRLDRCDRDIVYMDLSEKLFLFIQKTLETEEVENEIPDGV